MQQSVVEMHHCTMQGLARSGVVAPTALPYPAAAAAVSAALQRAAAVQAELAAAPGGPPDFSWYFSQAVQMQLSALGTVLACVRGGNATACSSWQPAADMALALEATGVLGCCPSPGRFELRCRRRAVRWHACAAAMRHRAAAGGWLLARRSCLKPQLCWGCG